MLWGSAKQMESSVQCTRGVQRKQEQHAVHKRGCAKHYGSGVQCTRGGVQSEMSAVCNAPELCKAKWERRAFARGVCNARGGWGGGGGGGESGLRERVTQHWAKGGRGGRGEDAYRGRGGTA